ncbi:blast:Cadherin-related tumor suppressor [Drosophila guanche]|uniref:Blast:Cadherin-related tumor suppressor n=2 Tax=Drosophila guanche TaxID=7266 RepID=A0A3B0JEL3_DROGU|nr:blast:Cadherin-related tumor suppressor [Drosophila guanche]
MKTLKSRQRQVGRKRRRSEEESAKIKENAPRSSQEMMDRRLHGRGWGMQAGVVAPLVLLFVLSAMDSGCQAADTKLGPTLELLAPRGRSYATTYEQYAAFPRRRSSSPAGEMQSRAVDTSADFEVLEGQPRGTLVGFIPTKPKFTYRFNEPPREFSLDPVTGEVKTNLVLDREGMRDHYDLVVLSSQPTYPIEVRIKVLDINDNAPEFPEPSIAVSFSESAVSGTRLLLDAATDADTGENGVTDQYEIVAGNVDHKFRLATTTNPSGDTSYLHLETTGNLDRESRGSYQLNISARDGGSPPRLGYLQVNVTILDVNDNPPIFDHSDYNVSLNETAVAGTPVVTVMASDNDLGDNSKLTYYLAETEHQFTVDPETGVISTTERVNCPQQTQQNARGGGQKSCVFTVFARDHGSPRQDGRTYVTVNLLDTNDHDPIIRFQYFPPTGNVATVDENAVNGTVVAAVSVIDSDDGLNGETTTRIVSGNELGHFRLEKTPLFHIVRVNGVLDREEIGKYNLTVVAMDKGTPARTTTAHLIIDVNDVNDHEPVFEKSEYSAVLSELAPTGSYVASITATDEDTGVNAQVHYEILSGNELKWFSIDSATGLIATAGALDREIKDSVELSISARDGGPNPKFAYTQLKVTVLDENDEAPQFGQRQLNVSLSEDVPAQSLVSMLTATDHDQGTNGSVAFSLAPSVERLYPQQFAIDSITGQLTTRKALDRETMANYEIFVIARDQGAPTPQSATATVYLSVADINDNDPEFYPKHYIYTFSDVDDHGQGQGQAKGQENGQERTLLHVTATDRDAGDNALITYNLESGGEGLFHVDAHSGAVLLRGDMLRTATKPHYKLLVSARDSGQRRSAQNAVVDIVTETSTTTQLECGSQGAYEFHLTEDHEQQQARLGREVGLVQVKVKGQVATAAAAIQYVIIHGDRAGNFAIDAHSGRITTARPIDREEQSHYRLVILASSSSSSSATGIVYGKCNVNIAIIDLNDNAPSFALDRDAEPTISLPENAAVGQEIYLSRVRDRDAGINSRVSYNLTHNPEQQFRIGPVTGVLYLQRPVRADPGSILRVELMATDAGSPPLSNRLSLLVHVADVNDHTPVFDHTSYETSLLETTKVNTRFFALAATDIDLEENGRISYEIIEGNADRMFGVFPDGYLFVRAPLDREERDYYALTVSCQDAGNPSRSSVVPVVIHVIDENDNAPQFTNSTFTFSIPENAPADTFVGKLLAVDRDIGRNAELSFTLSSQTQDFTIDTRNGFIKTLRPFDREALVKENRNTESGGSEDERSASQRGGFGNYMMLEAMVSDNGSPRLHDKVKVKVIVTDVNDNAPEFLRAPYHVTLSEGASEGTHIMHVFTQDADEGLNGDVYYSLARGNEAGLFTLDSATGQLTLARRLDRESQEVHQLIVVARDAALKQPLSSNASISIVVLDENDNAPEFTQSSSEVSVLETSPSGTELMRFRASDADQGVNNQVVFSISAGNRRDTFHIDSMSGSLYLHKALDYEDITSYTLNITASDCGTPSLSTTVIYNVVVVDDNDNPPIFPSTAIVRQIKEGIALKTPIVTVTADDPDSGLNGKVGYAISRQEPELPGGRHFGINTETGVIHTLREIDRETIDTFRLTVVATDRAQPSSRQLSTEKLVTVIVEDINDNAPIFVSMNAAILPPKLQANKEQPVIQVQARDADSSSNGLVTYEIVSGPQELFRLQRNTGIITFSPGVQYKPEIRHQLTLKATDEAVQSERRSSEVYITIITTGSDLSVPVFEQLNALSGSVYENEPIGTSILTVSAHLQGSEIEYFVTNVTANGNGNRAQPVQVDRLFDIDAKLGILSTAAELDREAGPDSYEVEVYAIALGGQPRTAHTKVKVTVLDKNDSPPQFLDAPFVYNVSEELEIGHTIATIRAHDPDTLGTVTFMLINGHDGKFQLDASTGRLALNDTLDRETKSKYDVRVRVSDGVQYTETYIVIEVSDTNDNPPMFEESVYSFDIPENAPRGYQVGQVVARDADLGPNAQLSYGVVSDWANDVFSLNPQTGMLTLTARLDYEEVQHYILIVQAQDSGQPSLSTTITVYCNVLDLNDNAPLFDPMSYSSEVFENVPTGMEVVTVSAKDIDSGNNGLIEYIITAGDADEEFGIDSNGTIRTRRQLDRERRSSYTLTVTARDCADEIATFSELEETQLKLKYRSPRRYQQTQQQQQFLAHQKQQRLSSTVKVTILIKDINDEVPVFVSANETSIMENVAINTVVIAVKAVDNDEGRNGYIDYLLEEAATGGDDNEPLPFSLNPTDGLVRVVDALDRELRASYVLNITARDRGEPPQETATQLLVRILDENDNSPVFDPKQYSASVAENASIGAMVLQVSATDVDEGANGRIRYSIMTGDQNQDFSISEDTGVVRVAKNLNYERKARYTLTVRAEDCALENSASDTAELTIGILDINDNRPTFLDSPYLARVMENTVPPNDGYVLTVNAYDADTPPLNSQVRYFLKEGDTDLFRINASTGAIALLKPLDRELQSEYILTLVAMDTGSPPLTGTGIVRVEVQDINDNGPVFELQSYHARIQENLPIGTLVLQPTATDKDAGLNAKLRFNLLGEHMSRFHIDTETGEITTATVLDREETAVYRLTLMAQDSSITEPRASSVNLTITVSDVNDNEPTFESGSYSTAVPDRIAAGEFVFGARAVDLDEGDNAVIHYSISGRDKEYFEVNIKTGAISTRQELKTAKKPPSETSFSIVMHATDQGQTPQSSTAELSVLLRPAELFPTYAYMANTRFTLPEDVQPGKIVTRVAATSPKKGSAGNVRYGIAGGNMGDALRIDASSGALSVGHDGLDYELTHVYEIWVEAADGDRPSLRSVMLVTINVTDANDNAPIMERLIYNAEVLEEESPPQLIAVVKARDRDSGDNGEVSYRLSNDYESTFEITDAGEIYTTMRLDREELSDYSFVVEAVDQGVPQLTGTASVLLHLLDKNDNPPKFTRLFSLNVTENAEIGSFVIRVTSSDLDLGQNANATYSFSANPGEKFRIEPLSGNITVAGHLDREQQDEYILKVVASDGAWRAETPITITIQDQNDNAPEFEHSFYSFSFPELLHPVALVGQIIATDRDKQGPNSVISYSLQQPSPMFSIDPATGEIFSKKVIQYKRSQYVRSPENMYALTILATDNGKPPLYSECLVNINIVDAKNNPPKFEQSAYLSPLPEHARPGQRIVRVHATDKQDMGAANEMDYALVNGNLSAFFTIGKHDGWISLAKPLLNVPTNTRFELTVKAIDHGVPPQTDQTRVTIVVTGENRHTPEFTARSYQVIVPENEPIGSTILTVGATDEDVGPNGMLRYAISGGNERRDFMVDERTGGILIRQQLDYDLVQEYHLNITVQDLGFQPQSAVAMLTIILTDVNDNPPLFNQSEYHGYVAENKPVGTFVFQAHATDKDSPKNAIVHYSFLPSGTDRHFFAMSSGNGTITSAASFDYEERRTYTMQLKAKNPDSSMESYATLFVHILGVNEFYPQFLQPVFHFDVSETSAVGTIVGAVQATDKDSGEDGRVYYLLVGSSNDKGFAINTHTGVIHVARHLDRETQNRVVLTVMAKNYGSIRGNDTDEAQVIISIQDGNDPPEFLKRYYTSVISEAAPIGTKVTTVRAVDKDVRPQNNQFSYSIINGNLKQGFKIDVQSGEISTAARLDREDIAHYSLVIGAIDTGLPPQTGSATVRIDLDDVNDNGPMFAPEGLLGYVSENEPAGTSIMTLSATDPDLPRNGGPFSYQLVAGKHKSWLSVDKVSGLVQSTASFDREITPTLEAIIEVEDSGKPRQRAQHTLTITVLDQNDNPSTPRNLHVTVSIFNGDLPAHVKLADIHPNDIDIVGDYRCRLQSQPQAQHQLAIPRGCDLYTTAHTTPTAYAYSYTGNDGKHSDVTSKLTVDFQAFNNETLAHTVSVLVRNMTAGQFLAQHYRPVVDMLKSRLASDDELFLYSLLGNGSGNASSLEVLLAVRSAKRSYQQPRHVIERLREKRAALSELLQKEVVIGYEPCSEPEVCENGGVCSATIRLLDTHSFGIVDSPTLVLSGPRIVHDYSCQCTNGFSGEQCNRRQDPCLPNPCQLQAQCRRIGNDFQCVCPSNRDGKQCQRERSDVCWSKPCRNGGSCQRSSDGSSYFCLCRPGFRGNQCESVSDSCRPNPCLHGGLCVNLKPGYKCSCTAGRYGRHCERFSYGFEPLSFMTFPALDVTTNDISIVFATTKPNSLLLYNYGMHSGGRSDFLAIELVHGQAYFSSGGARTAISTVVAGHNLADGSWHKVTATRNGRVMSLSVAKCADSGDVCAECTPGDSSCYADEVGPVGTLNFNKQPLLIGGLASADPILERPGQVHSDDLVGCLHSVHIAGRALNLSTPLSQRGILPGCNRQACQPSLAAERCGGYAGQCIDRWSSALCQCGGQLHSPDCSESLEPVTLSGGAFLEFRISELHRRMQLLDNLYNSKDAWSDSSTRERRQIVRQNISSLPAAASQIYEAPKVLSLLFRTYKAQGLLLYSATNQMFTSLSLKEGKLVYYSRQQLTINMTVQEPTTLHDGRWHNVSLHSESRSLQLFIDGRQVGDELDIAGVHDFLDPYLTTLTVGGAPSGRGIDEVFVGCVANFTINHELQPLNGSGSIFPEVRHHGKVELGCSGDIGVDAAQVADPLSIGITLVIVFFVILVVAILGSYVIYRFRGKQEKIGSLSCGVPGFKIKHPGGVLGGPPVPQVDHVLARGLHPNEAPAPPVGANEHLRPPTHHLVGPELLTKKFKERSELTPTAELPQPQQRPQRPDIIEREVVGKSPLIREEHHLSMPPPNAMHPLDHGSSVDMGSEYPEHYDLENASSIAPSDIDIVYHYKGYREAGGMRKYKATSPPVAAYTHHKHQSAASQQQHRHSPRVAPFVSRNQGGQPPPPNSASRTHQSTPLARLSPSSELSSQQPRILTLHDISGKPLQSALLATTSSSGGVGKDALHSNSERSLNSPVMSQLSGQSSSASRQKPGVPQQAPPQTSMGLTAEEIERLNARPRACSLVSTLDAVSSSSEAPRVPSSALHMSLGGGMHNTDVDAHSSTSTDESGNDSFTCSEIEYDNNSLSGDGKYSTSKSLLDGRSPVARALSGEPSRNPSVVKTPPIPPHPYDGFESSFRGSLSTLVASDDDIANHLSGIYRKANGAASPSATTLGWEYLLNWGPSYENLMGVFKDIAELPDTTGTQQQQQNQQQQQQPQQQQPQSVSTLRMPSNGQAAPEEYV